MPRADGDWSHIHDDDGKKYTHPGHMTCRMGLKKGFRYEHDGVEFEERRICTVTDTATWWYWETEENRKPCMLSHDKPGLHIPQVDLAKQASDRGEFGMPGVGMAGTVVSEWPLKPPPTDIMIPTLDSTRSEQHNWRVILTNDGLEAEFDGPGGTKSGYTTDATTPDARYIMEILPEIISHFLHKNTQYARAQTGHDLGIKGIIPDINRKSAAIITGVWDAPALLVDDLEEVIDDLIGHLLLMRAKMRDA